MGASKNSPELDMRFAGGENAMRRGNRIARMPPTPASVGSRRLACQRWTTFLEGTRALGSPQDKDG
jgi:hypothetical protein